MTAGLRPVSSRDERRGPCQGFVRARGGYFLQSLNRFPALRKGVVERRWSESQDIRFSKVRNESSAPQRQRNGLRLLVPERNVAAAALRFTRRPDAKPEFRQLGI